MKIEINTLEYKDTTRCIFIQHDNDVFYFWICFCICVIRQTHYRYQTAT
jgi:hypothetical protein